MTVQGEFFAGLSLGFEFFADDEYGNGILFDLLIFRIMFIYD